MHSDFESGDHGVGEGECPDQHLYDRIRAIADASQGDATRWAAVEALYPQLRTLALAEMDGDTSPQTLQVTALLHETLMRLLGVENVQWPTPRHFFAYSATIMRRILIDHARRRKRWAQPELDPNLLDEDLTRCEHATGCDVATLERVLIKLRSFDPVAAEMVDQRFVLGRTMDAVATSLGMSVRSAERKWSITKLWIKQELARDT